jgi:UDP-N-acetylglucosamine:LPS N-acetylglucosamine transferase
MSDAAIRADIVERLRLLKSGAAWYCDETEATLEDAADEIERLLAERDRLREALTKIAASSRQLPGQMFVAFAREVITQEALKETGHEADE